MRKHWEVKLLVASIFTLSLSATICHFSGYWTATVLLLLPAICLLCLWLGINIGLSGKYCREDFLMRKKEVTGKITEVN